MTLGEPRHTNSFFGIFIGHCSFRTTFNGRRLTIGPGTSSTVQIGFIPQFEGRFEATLQLIFESQQLDRFAVHRRLRAIAGSLDDHERFESLNQDGYVPRSGTGQQIPLEKIIPLPNPAPFGDIPEYELPALVQEAVDRSTFKRPYDKKAPALIATLRPRELTMDTYAQFFTALLNVEEGHQQYVYSLSLLPNSDVRVDETFWINVPSRSRFKCGTRDTCMFFCFAYMFVCSETLA